MSRECDHDDDFADLLGANPSGGQDGAPDDAVSSRELAEWLGISTNRIATLARSGILPRNPDKRNFPLRQTVTAYCEHLRQGATGRLSANPDLAEEKVRLARANAEKIEIQNARARDELVALADVRAEWTAFAVDLRARLLAVGPRVSSALGLERETAARIDSEIRDALTEIADDG